MSKFRKKSLVIEAEQFDEKDCLSPNGGRWPKGVLRDPGENQPFYVITIHGQRAFLADGDWILPEPDGDHFYPCKPDVFAERYELVEL